MMNHLEHIYIYMSQVIHHLSDKYEKCFHPSFYRSILFCGQEER